MSQHKLILPPGVAQPTAEQDKNKYMPHLKHVHEYMAGLDGLDQADRVGILMVATVVAITEYAKDVQRTRSRSQVMESAVAEFRRKLKRYMR